MITKADEWRSASNVLFPRKNIIHGTKVIKKHSCQPMLLKNIGLDVGIKTRKYTANIMGMTTKYGD